MLGDLTNEELACLCGDDAPEWARAAVEMRARLIDALEEGSLEAELACEVERLHGELRRSAHGAAPDVVAQMGRVRGAMASYLLELRRRDL